MNDHKTNHQEWMEILLEQADNQLPDNSLEEFDEIEA